MKNLFLNLYGKFEIVSGGLVPLADLAMRLVMARMFLKSGWVKVKDFEGAIDLFAYEYFDGIPYLLATALAAMATIGETVLPVLLAFGLFSRFAAAGLLLLTAVISLIVYPIWSEPELWWNDHVWWAVILLAILAWGPQKYSMDHWWFSGKKRVSDI